MPPRSSRVPDKSVRKPRLLRRKGRGVLRSESKQPRCGIKPPPILGMRRPSVLLLQMNKRTCELNEPFIIRANRLRRAQPEMLQNIVRLIVFAQVKAPEKPAVARVPSFNRCRLICNRSLHTFAFLHRGKITGDYLPQPSARQALPPFAQYLRRMASKCSRPDSRRAASRKGR